MKTKVRAGGRVQLERHDEERLEARVIARSHKQTKGKVEETQLRSTFRMTSEISIASKHSRKPSSAASPSRFRRATAYESSLTTTDPFPPFFSNPSALLLLTLLQHLLDDLLLLD